MNYRHAFHAGNHADVLKHLVLLALCDALTAKPAACFALDTHAGRGLYRLDDDPAQRTGEAGGGIDRVVPGHNALIDRYLAAIAACKTRHGSTCYPGSPWLLAHALRPQDSLHACEWQAEEAAALKHQLGHLPRLHLHHRDGYAAMKALLPPRTGSTRLARGLVLVDPPYETQQAEFDSALAAIGASLLRWPQGMYALWYPIKQRRSLARTYRQAATLAARSLLRVELCVRPDDSPLRLNGSGLLIWNAPWQFDATLQPALALLAAQLGEDGTGQAQLGWLKAPA